MKRKNLLFVLLALLLVFTLAACGGNKATESPEKAPAATTEVETAQPEATKAEETQPTAAPTESAEEPTAEPTEEPQEEMSSEFAHIEDVVDSYRSKGGFNYEITATPADEEADVKIDMTVESEWVKADNPFGYNSSMTMSGMNMPTGAAGEGDENQPSEFQIVSVDDTTYMKIGDQWVNMPRDESGTDGSDILNIDDFVTGMEDMKKVGKETINGINAVHYTYKDSVLTEKMFQDMLSTQLKDGETVDNYQLENAEASGDIWIATKGNYPVKGEFKMNATYKSKTGDKQIEIKGHTLVEITEINGDITIEPPADAPKPGQVDVPGFEPGTFPIPEQTTVEGSMMGMTTMTSQLSVDEVASFYDENLTSMGWSKGEGMMPTWTKDSNSFTLLITPGENNTTSIVVMPAQQ